MRLCWNWMLLGIFLLLICGLALSCGDDDSSDDGGSDSPVLDDDDDVIDDDDSIDDDDDDDDTVDDDDDTVDDDDDDDDTVDDDFLAPWPQSNIEDHPYNEALSAGALRQKVEQYDQWHLDYHQPYQGGTIGTVFTDDTWAVVDHYFDWGDSCEWTGLYLGSQAMRYHITGDAQAKANALRAAQYLSGNLHVTGTPGFIARYWADQDSVIYPGDSWCDDPAQARCHHVESGTYADKWWWGETSRDMYNGWFFGMSMAYDLVDDEDMRDRIRADVTEVINTLRDQGWTILDEEGEPTDSAPQVQPTFRLAWLLIAYHITGDVDMAAEIKTWLKNDSRMIFRLYAISFMNRYTQYYASCLSHEYWYNLLRLGKVYFSDDDYNFFLNVFETQGHTFQRLSHNPWFNGVYMGQGDYQPVSNDPYQNQLVEDLTAFPEAPNHRYYLPDRDSSTYTLDPLSVFLSDLMDDYPFLQNIMGNVDYQADEAFTVDQQCSTDFLFQRNPFQIYACGGNDASVVNPGVDYLISYWLASYHGFVTKDN